VVDRKIHAEVVRRLAAEFTKVRVGPGTENVDMGPLISARQHERVLKYMDIGREEGAEVVTGGGVPVGEKFERGYFVEPTIFDRVAPDMRIAQEEIFGPVLSVIPVDGDAEALQVANGTEYGLVAAVWTSDIGRAVTFARGLQAGQVAVNQILSGGVIGAPFGGYKGSGFGRTMGADSVLNFTQSKTVSIRGTR
jgi:acyl-CoA reductase-like NAD-dependent aldehyde dehydrogenase